MTTAKPHLRIIAGRPVRVDADPRIAAARQRFGRNFAHESGANFLRHPELVLSRWSRRADYWNLNPNLPRPQACTLHFAKRGTPA